MARHSIFTTRFISIYILVLFYFNLSAQDQCPQNYKLVEKFKLETNSNLIRVNGSIKGKNGYRFFARGPYSIYLHSDDTTYHCIENSLNRFKFGYIKPGIYKLKICSNDPICGEQKPHDKKIIYAACYSCLLLPETSCEFNNNYLDRNCLVGDGDGINSVKGFFVMNEK